jgi:hypothetical protein
MSELDFVGISSITDATSTTICRDSLIEWLDWGFLAIGGFQNVTLPRSGTYGSLESKLIKNPSANVFNTFRSNLVWQSGIGAMVGSNNILPGVSGVYVSGAFKSSNISGYFAHSIDHVNGKVTFNNNVGNDVKMEYSYKWANVCPVDDVAWFKRIHDGSTNVNNVTASGLMAIDPRLRVQLPAVGVEFANRVEFKPYQLGGGQYKMADILFHCIAETREEADKLSDIVSMQNDRSIPLIDLDGVAASSDYPINYKGVPNSGALRYPDLIASHPLGRNIRIFDMISDASYNLNDNIFVKSLRCTSELILNIS